MAATEAQVFSRKGLVDDAQGRAMQSGVCHGIVPIAQFTFRLTSSHAARVGLRLHCQPPEESAGSSAAKGSLSAEGALSVVPGISSKSVVNLTRVLLSWSKNFRSPSNFAFPAVSN